MGKDEVRRARQDANALAGHLTDAVTMAGKLSETAEAGGFKYLSARRETIDAVKAIASNHHDALGSTPWHQSIAAASNS